MWKQRVRRSGSQSTSGNHTRASVLCEALEPRKLLCGADSGDSPEDPHDCVWHLGQWHCDGTIGQPGPGDPTGNDPPPPAPPPPPDPAPQPPAPEPPPNPEPEPDPEQWHVNLVVMGMAEHDEECPGGFMPVNNDFDENNKDNVGDPVPDNVYDATHGPRIVAGDDELRPATLYITAPEGITQGIWSIGTPGVPKVNLWMWKPAPVNKWVDIGGGYSETSAMPLTRSFIVEGITHSTALRDVTIHASASGEADFAKLTVLEVDADVDSDNNNGFENPGRTVKEDGLEDKQDEPGKILAVNDGDVDGDGIPDFADGYGLYGGDSETLEGISFIPFILDVSGVMFSEDARVGFLYTPSNPAGVVRTGSGTSTDPYEYTLPLNGSLRLWSKNADERTPTGANVPPSNPLLQGGRFIQPYVQYGLSDFTDADVEEISPGVFRFWIEAVRPTAATITVLVDPDGEGSAVGFMLQDAVRVSSIKVDLDIDSDNTGLFEAPERSDAEDVAEAHNGAKVIVVNRDDDDDDGILDFADGFGLFGDSGPTANEQFVPVKLDVPSFDAATVQFEYEGADPSSDTVRRRAISTDGLDGQTYTTYNYFVGSGLLRLWRRAGDEPRTQDDYIEPGQAYSLTELNLTDDTLWLEAVNGSTVPTTISVTYAIPNAVSATDLIKVMPLDSLVGLSAEEITGYRIVRGNGSSIIGSDEKDILIGTNNNEEIHGLGGDDIILPGHNDPDDVNAVDDPAVFDGDSIDGGAGSDLVFAWFGNNSILWDPADMVSRMEGSRVPDDSGAGGPEGGNSADQPFSSQDIITYYKWMYGADDIWLRGFDELGGKVFAVKQDGRWFSDWTIDWHQNGPFGPYVGYDIKIEYDVGVMKAAALLREGIMSTAFHDSPRWDTFLLNENMREMADGVIFGEALVSWQALRARNFEYAKQIAEIAGDLYISGMTVAAGVGGDIADTILNFDDTLETAGELAKGAMNLLRHVTGSVAGWIREPDVTAGPLLDAPGDPTEPPHAPASGPDVIPQSARAALRFAGIVRYKEWNDVVRPMYRVGNDFLESPVGFVWRRDLLPGAEDTLRMVPHVAHGRMTMIVGTAQQTSGTHAATINRVSRAIINDNPNKQYLHVGLNRSPRTMLDDGVTPGRRLNDANAPHNRHRPDIIAVYWDPATNSPKVELYEVQSGTQTLAQLEAKLQTIMAELPAAWRTDVMLALVQDPPG